MTTAAAAYVFLPVVFVWAGVPCGSVRDHTVMQFRESGMDFSRIDWMRPFLDRKTVVCPPDQVDP